MPNLAPNPCEDGHPELGLLLDVTRLDQRLPEYHCNRCGNRLTYEQAIRNDERIRIIADIKRRGQ